jgi:hypothetical protein
MISIVRPEYVELTLKLSNGQRLQEFGGTDWKNPIILYRAFWVI